MVSYKVLFSKYFSALPFIIQQTEKHQTSMHIPILIPLRRQLSLYSGSLFE